MKYILTYIFLISTICLNAQNNNPNVLDNEFTPPVNSILGSENNEIPQLQGYESLCKNNIKFSSLNLLRSDILVSYEHLFKSKFSINFGGGIPFGNDNINTFFYGTFSNEFNILNDETDLSYSDIIENIKFKSGYILNGSLRLYAEQTFFEFGVRKVFRTVMYDTLSNANTNHIELLQPEINTSLTNYFFNVGWHFTSGKNKVKLSHEFGLGVAVNNFTYDSYTRNNIFFDSDIDKTVYTKNGSKVHELGPKFNFFYNIGLGW